MKRIFLILISFCALVLWAEVGIISVTEEDKHRSKEDFYHTFEYFIESGQTSGAKCQATRIAPRWFVTAAHCVKDLCYQKGCTLRMDLLDTSMSVLAEGKHTTKNPSVFVYPAYISNPEVGNDIAIFRLDLNTAPKTYYHRATVKNTPHIAATEQTFTAWLAKNRKANSQYTHVLSPQLPPLVVFDNGNYALDRKTSVISIFGGKRKVQQNPNMVYYVKQLGYAYTTNFGIQKGMSGSGVMTNTGELIGIISASVWADFFKGKQKVEHKDWFMFPVFNEKIIAFMKEVMGSDFYKVDQKDAYPSFVNKTRKDFSAVVRVMKKDSDKESKK